MSYYGFKREKTNIAYLQEHGVKIWDAWSRQQWRFRASLRHQWRNWNSEEIDQISDLITGTKTNPNSRRLLVSVRGIHRYTGY